MYAATENGGECFCGTESENYAQYGTGSGCTKVCPGDNTQMCGGSWQMSVFVAGNSHIVIVLSCKGKGA